MASTHEEVCGDELPKLIAAHPVLFAGRAFEITSYLPTGWYPIADTLCTDLATILSDNAGRFQPIQSKEKWGSWRFYWRLELDDDDDRPQAFNLDLVGLASPPAGVEGLSECDVQGTRTPGGFRISLLPYGELRQAVYARVRQAETATEATCMWCGEDGTYWTTGWVHVACAKHRRRDAMTLEAWHARQAARRQKYERGRGPGKPKVPGSDDE